MARSRSSAPSTSSPKAKRKGRVAPLSLHLPPRPRPSREQRRTILIATEDTASARNYLQRIAHEDAARQRCSVTFAEHTGSNPKSVAKAAKAANMEAAKKYNEVWLVFDTEGPQNIQRDRDAREVVETARQLKYETAISNPCYEYWLILHFERCTVSLIDDNAARQYLSHYLSDYRKGDDAYAKTRQHLGTALKNAEELYKQRCDRHQGHPCDCHPCTQMYRLITSLLGP